MLMLAVHLVWCVAMFQKDSELHLLGTAWDGSPREDHDWKVPTSESGCLLLQCLLLG